MAAVLDGVVWQQPIRVTFSFVPDGVSLGGAPSRMFSMMNSFGIKPVTWQLAFKLAFATWQAAANINFVEVPDQGGTIIGGLGAQQGDSRFGDVRIGAIPLGTGKLAVTYREPPKVGATLRGDMMFDSTVRWSMGGGTGFDVQTVALHEIGHVVGLEDISDDDIDSVETIPYEINGVQTTLFPYDIAGVRSIYGPQPPAPFYTKLNNAMDLTPWIKDNQIVVANQSVAYPASNFFRVTIPTTTIGTMTVSVQADGLSLLCPQVTIFGSNGQGLATKSMANMYGSTATVTLNVAKGQIYYIRANAATIGAGAYGLLVNFGGGTQAPILPPKTTTP